MSLPLPLENDPQDILMDDDGDIVLDEQGLHFVSGLQAVVQGARIRMGMFAEEWFLNLDIGIPYYEEIMFENYDEPTARAEFIAAILDVPGIVEVISLTLALDSTRTLTVTWQARTLFGDTPQDTLALAQKSAGPGVTE